MKSRTYNIRIRKTNWIVRLLSMDHSPLPILASKVSKKMLCILILSFIYFLSLNLNLIRFPASK